MAGTRRIAAGGAELALCVGQTGASRVPDGHIADRGRRTHGRPITPCPIALRRCRIGDVQSWLGQYWLGQCWLGQYWLGQYWRTGLSCRTQGLLEAHLCSGRTPVRGAPLLEALCIRTHPPLASPPRPGGEVETGRGEIMPRIGRDRKPRAATRRPRAPARRRKVDLGDGSECHPRRCCRASPTQPGAATLPGEATPPGSISMPSSATSPGAAIVQAASRAGGRDERIPQGPGIRRP